MQQKEHWAAKTARIEVMVVMFSILTITSLASVSWLKRALLNGELPTGAGWPAAGLIFMAMWFVGKTIPRFNEPWLEVRDFAHGAMGATIFGALGSMVLSWVA